MGLEVRTTWCLGGWRTARRGIGEGFMEQRRVRTASGLGTAAAVVALVAVVSGYHHVVWVAVGLLVAAAAVIRPLLGGQRFSSWIAWIVGALDALLLAWAEPVGRVGELAVAGVLGLGACALWVGWCRHRGP